MSCERYVVTEGDQTRPRIIWVDDTFFPEPEARLTTVGYGTRDLDSLLEVWRGKKPAEYWEHSRAVDEDDEIGYQLLQLLDLCEARGLGLEVCDFEFLSEGYEPDDSRQTAFLLDVEAKGDRSYGITQYQQLSFLNPDNCCFFSRWGEVGATARELRVPSVVRNDPRMLGLWLDGRSGYHESHEIHSAIRFYGTPWFESWEPEDQAGWPHKNVNPPDAGVEDDRFNRSWEAAVAWLGDALPTQEAAMALRYDDSLKALLCGRSEGASQAELPWIHEKSAEGAPQRKLIAGYALAAILRRLGLNVRSRGLDVSLPGPAGSGQGYTLPTAPGLPFLTSLAAFCWELRREGTEAELAIEHSNTFDEDGGCTLTLELLHQEFAKASYTTQRSGQFERVLNNVRASEVPHEILSTDSHPLSRALTNTVFCRTWRVRENLVQPAAYLSLFDDGYKADALGSVERQQSECVSITFDHGQVHFTWPLDRARS